MFISLHERARVGIQCEGKKEGPVTQREVGNGAGGGLGWISTGRGPCSWFVCRIASNADVGFGVLCSSYWFSFEFSLFPHILKNEDSDSRETHIKLFHGFGYRIGVERVSFQKSDDVSFILFGQLGMRLLALE